MSCSACPVVDYVPSGACRAAWSFANHLCNTASSCHLFNIVPQWPLAMCILPLEFVRTTLLGGKNQGCCETTLVAGKHA